MQESLGVGVIGASAARGWAKDSHIPAIQRLNGVHLAAVAAGDQAKAQEAKQAFGAEAGYASGLELIQDPRVDIVTVAVKVPDHRELVLAALAAGKHVYCEWPLGRNVIEAEEMAKAAAEAGVCTAIGLQMRSSKAMSEARKAIAEERIGRSLSANITSNTAAFGPDVEAAMAFGEDPLNGVTLTTIQGAHTFDLAMAVLGGVESLTALVTTQFLQVTVGERGAAQARVTGDHVLLAARLSNGLPVGIEVAGGRAKDAPTTFTVSGTKGVLTIHGGAMRGVQSGRLEWLIDGKIQPLDEGVIAAMPDAAANVAGIYALMQNDIQNGTKTVPDFEHAVKLARFTDAVLTSSENGIRLSNRDWPTS